MALRGFVEHRSAQLIEGWCFDEAAPAAALEVVLLVAGAVRGRTWSDRYRADLADAGYGTGHHGFQFQNPGLDRDLAGVALEIRVVCSGGAWIRLPVLGHGAAGEVAPEPATHPPVTRAGRRLRRCVLHIGLEKAGSSSLQRFLAINHAVLLARGFLVPASLAQNGARDLYNHSALTAYALDIAKETDAIRALHCGPSASQIDQFRDQTMAALAQEIASAPAGVDTLVLSNEHLHSRLREPSEIKRLWYLLSAFCDSIEVLVYLRPQHRVAVSAHTTLVKNGALHENVFPPLVSDTPWAERELQAYYDYDALVQRWQAGFGAACVTVRVAHDRIEAQWLDTIALPGTGFTPLAARVNVGLSAAGLHILRRINQALVTLPYARAQQIRDQVIPALDLHYAGVGAVGYQAQAIAFQARFAASNAALRRRCFAEQPMLFEEDFSLYSATTATAQHDAASAEALVTPLLQFFLNQP